MAVTIDADAPDARVTFRRRVTPTPMTVEVAPGDMVELVEVSAPGRVTVRYWITIDRPTRLHARLAAGTGLVEATELDTVIALDEVADAAGAAPAPAAAPAREKREHRSSRRSIGRAAAPADVAAVEVAAADSVPPGEPTGVEPIEAPAPSAAAPGDEPVAPAAPAGVEGVRELVPPPAAPKAAPKRVAAAFLEASRIAGNAKILPDNGTRQAMRHVGATRVTGRFQLCAAADGAVTRVTMTSSSGYPDYDQQIIKALRAWQFKPITIEGRATAVCTSIAIAYNQQ